MARFLSITVFLLALFFISENVKGDSEKLRRLLDNKNDNRTPRSLTDVTKINSSNVAQTGIISSTTETNIRQLWGNVQQKITWGLTTFELIRPEVNFMTCLCDFYTSFYYINATNNQIEYSLSRYHIMPPESKTTNSASNNLNSQQLDVSSTFTYLWYKILHKKLERRQASYEPQLHSCFISYAFERIPRMLNTNFTLF